MPDQLKISCYGCQSKLDVTDLEPFTKILCPVCKTKIIVPKPFGNLLLEENMGKGLMSTVYRAMDITLDREIAVKVLNPEFAADSEIPREFINEARMASAINHPNVIPIYSCGNMDGQPYIIMQFMEGGSLARRLERSREPVPLRDACKWFMETLKGLESAYIHGVLHHDVSPSNIFLDLDNNVKVGDFGLAQAIYRNMPLKKEQRGSEGVVPITRTRAQYVSPERINTGRQDVSGDIYSLGAAFYHVLTGESPYQGQTAEEVLLRHLEATPRPPAELRSEIPPELSEMLMKTLRTYPSDRPKSYAEVAGVVEKTLEKLGGGKREGGSRPRTDEHREASPARKPSTRKKSVVPAVARPTPQVAVRPPSSSLWLWRLIPILVIAVVVFLALAHVNRWPWYESYIRPYLPQSADPGGGGDPPPK